MLAAVVTALVMSLPCTPLPTCSPTITTNCATPTPTVRWDPIADLDLAGFEIQWRGNGDSFARLAAIPCEWGDLDEDGVLEYRLCKGADFDIPLQRHCPLCEPFNEYEFAVIAYDDAGHSSIETSNIVTVCFSPLCDYPGPCD